VLPALVLAALAAMPPTAPPTGLPPATDPCIALTPAVVDQLRTSGVLTPLVPDDVPTSSLIMAGRALTGCPPANDPDPATVQAHVCPLLTAEGVEALADRFRATPAVRADLGPERLATARSALHCDSPSATASETTTAGGGALAGTGENSRNTVDQADRGVLQQPAVAAVLVVIAALIGILALIGRAVRRRRFSGESGASGNVRSSRYPAEPTRPERQQTTDAADGRAEGHRQPPPEGASGVRGRPDEHSDSYEELLAGLRREVAELRRADEAIRTDPRPEDDPQAPNPPSGAGAPEP
jgi:hypothetical protein